MRSFVRIKILTNHSTALFHNLFHVFLLRENTMHRKKTKISQVRNFQYDEAAFLLGWLFLLDIDSHWNSERRRQPGELVTCLCLEQEVGLSLTRHKRDLSHLFNSKHRFIPSRFTENIPHKLKELTQVIIINLTFNKIILKLILIFFYCFWLCEVKYKVSISSDKMYNQGVSSSQKVFFWKLKMVILFPECCL